MTSSDEFCPACLNCMSIHENWWKFTMIYENCCFTSKPNHVILQVNQTMSVCVSVHPHRSKPGRNFDFCLFSGTASANLHDHNIHWAWTLWYQFWMTLTYSQGLSWIRKVKLFVVVVVGWLLNYSVCVFVCVCVCECACVCVCTHSHAYVHMRECIMCVSLV